MAKTSRSPSVDICTGNLRRLVTPTQTVGHLLNVFVVTEATSVNVLSSPAIGSMIDVALGLRRRDSDVPARVGRDRRHLG